MVFIDFSRKLESDGVPLSADADFHLDPFITDTRGGRCWEICYPSMIPAMYLLGIAK